MKAVELALLAYHKHFQMKAIHFQIDNTTILSYVVKMGRTKNKYLMELQLLQNIFQAPWMWRQIGSQ